MFDWNDEELTNIIWGENRRNDDHIVPYQEESEDNENKEWSQEAAANKPPERKTTVPKIKSNGGKLESTSSNSFERSFTSGFGMGSLSDISNAAGTDEKRMGADVSNRIAEIIKANSTSSAVKAELNKDSELFKNPEEDKDQGDFVDYSWANIGSFDDLDGIFSNDDPIFGNVSLGTGDEIWPSSKDVTNSPLKSFTLSEELPCLELGALKDTSEHMEVKPEFEQHDDKLYLSDRKLSNPAHDLQTTDSALDQFEYGGDIVASFEKEQSELGTVRNDTASKSGTVAEHVVSPEKIANQGCKQNNLLRGRRKLVEETGGKLLQGSYDNWSITENPSVKYENQLAHPVLSTIPYSVSNQKKQLPKSETLQYQQTSNPFVTASGHGNLSNPYPAMPVLSHMQSHGYNHQVLPAKANLINKSPVGSAKPLTMTPQEKIEKLRRRQQMQAMLAIQKQQQQFSHQLSGDHSNPQNFHENQIQFVGEADLEVGDLSMLPSLDPNSAVEQDESNTIHLAMDGNPLAETIVNRLQDVIAQLDIRIRLCMRDSLFRLSQSSTQRHYDSDTGSTNKRRDEPEVFTEADNKHSSRYHRMPIAEKETNPIDRTVAHLLFHTPLDVAGKHPATLELPASAKFSREHATMCTVNLKMSTMPDSPKISQNLSQQGPNDPCPVPESQRIDQFHTSPGMDTSENASNYGPADSRAGEVEASW